MMAKSWIIMASLSAFIGVMMGSFGAHGFKDRLTAGNSLDIFEVAVRYQMYHALGLLAVGLLADRWAGTSLTVAGWSFFIGIIIFSGSLYLLALIGRGQGYDWLGAITPIGGVGFLAGWIALAVAAWRNP
jgi:uncharacterized membrane protein YgdD (TMEM256/DUF423 family)